MKKIISIRRVTQIFILGGLIYLAWLHQRFGIEKAAPIDAYCPFGAVESLITWITSGHFLNRVFISSFLLIGIFIILTFFFGRVFCGYFCPLGALQEWIRILGQKFKIRKAYELPEKWDKKLRPIKYILLILLAGLSFYYGDLVFRHYDPFNALFHLGQELEEKWVGYSLLILVLIVALFSKNLWCRYLCPLGGFLGLIKKISPFHIGRDHKACVHCRLCQSTCPANLKVGKNMITRSADCISCGKCITHCPKSSLQYRFWKWTIPKKWFSALVIISFFLPLIIIINTPYWKTSVASNLVSTSGEIDIDNLRGSNTLAHVIEITGIPLSVFQQQFSLDE